MDDKHLCTDEKQAVKQEFLIMTLLFLIALIVRFWFLPGYKVISADGIGYVGVAKALMSGNATFWSPNHPPVYPALIAAVGLVISDMELAGRIVSIIMGSLLAPPLYLLGRDLFSREAGILAALLAVTWPPLRGWSCEVMSQATYLTLLVTGLYLLLRTVRTKHVILGFCAGLLLGIAYLTRPEALLIFFVLILLAGCYFICTRESGSHRLKPIVFILAGFGICFIPYLFVIKNVTGSWQLTGKTGAALADALSGYLGRPDLKRDPSFQTLGYLDVLRMYPDFLIQNSVHNLIKTWQILAPTWLWTLAIIGCACAGKTRESIGERLLLLSLLAPLFVLIPFFFVGPEYLQFYLPPLFLWAAHGLVITLNFIGSRIGFEPQRTPYEVTAVTYLALGLAMIYLTISLYGQLPKANTKPYHFSDDGARYDQKRIGLLLKENLPSGSKIMSRSGRIIYYSGLPGIDMPQAPLDEILLSARKDGVRFLVVEGHLLAIRPQLGVLFAPFFEGTRKIRYEAEQAKTIDTLDLRLYFLYKHPSSVGVAVYEILQPAQKTR